MEKRNAAKKFTILIAEDEEGIRQFMASGLRRKGFIVLEASNGKEAMDRIAEYKPDLLILDAMMPAMNGFEVCRIMRDDEKYKDILILFCTAMSLSQIRQKKLSVDGYIRKPFTADELYEKAAGLLKIKES